MSLRAIITLATYAVSFGLLFAAFPSDNSEPFEPLALLPALLAYVALSWLRDRYLPREGDRESAEAPQSVRSSLLGIALMRKVSPPWPTVYTCIVLAFVPLLIAVLIASPESQFLEVTMRAYPFWVALVSTAALMWMREPTLTKDRLMEWWLPTLVVALTAVGGTQLLPDLTWLVVTRGGEAPFSYGTVAPATLPMCALLWRWYSSGKAARKT